MCLMPSVNSVFSSCRPRSGSFQLLQHARAGHSPSAPPAGLVSWCQHATMRALHGELKLSCLPLTGSDYWQKIISHYNPCSSLADAACDVRNEEAAVGLARALQLILWRGSFNRSCGPFALIGNLTGCWNALASASCRAVTL